VCKKSFFINTILDKEESSMTDKIRPLYDRLYIERLESNERTASGLYIPEGAKEKGQTGKVLATGLGKIDQNGKTHSLQVKVGDVVFFGKYAGTDIDEKHLVLREEDILGIVE
jgi:chaperonin GroES